jgi:hypothetical protein
MSHANVEVEQGDKMHSSQRNMSQLMNMYKDFIESRAEGSRAKGHNRTGKMVGAKLGRAKSIFSD